MTSGRAIDIGFVCLALALFGMAVKFHRDAPVETRAEVFPAGTELPSDYPRSTGRSQLLLAFQSECKFCLASVDFYTKLAAHLQDRGIDFRVITLEPPAAVQATLRSALGHGGTVVQVPRFDFRGTPAIVLVNASNRVVESWLGWLSPDLEQKVIDATGERAKW
jgi:hypothetical protein